MAGKKKNTLSHLISARAIEVTVNGGKIVKCKNEIWRKASSKMFLFHALRVNI